ncbi:hypothetical protein, partial [Pseudophaeobacter sp.]|uniref:hypothetical protein n=1 Tax=Pseudophaeobacter sp. TaxID=1971739 RepID=UPI002632589D
MGMRVVEPASQERECGLLLPSDQTPIAPGSEAAGVTFDHCVGFWRWLRELDLNQRPSGYEP